MEGQIVCRSLFLYVLYFYANICRLCKDFSTRTHSERRRRAEESSEDGTILVSARSTVAGAGMGIDASSKGKNLWWKLDGAAVRLSFAMCCYRCVFCPF